MLQNPSKHSLIPLYEGIIRQSSSTITRLGILLGIGNLLNRQLTRTSSCPGRDHPIFAIAN